MTDKLKIILILITKSIGCIQTLLYFLFVNRRVRESEREARQRARNARKKNKERL